MKKTICFLMLVISITGMVCAQPTEITPDKHKPFEPPANSITRKFMIALDKGNRMQIEVSDLSDLNYFRNIDSMLNAFLQELLPFRDSMTDQLAARRIDCLTDSLGGKKIRIRQTVPSSSDFLLDHGEAAALKLQQDTLDFLGTVPYPYAINSNKNDKHIHYYRISFFVNQFSELGKYLDGRFNAKVSLMQTNSIGDWGKEKDGEMHLGKDPSISSRQAKGYTFGPADFLELFASVSVQNYKNYFAPAFNVGATVVLSNGYYRNHIGLHREMLFLFARDNQGTLQTYRNDFLTLSFGREPLHARNDQSEFRFLTPRSYSFSYLIRRKGDFFDDHTFRLGINFLPLRNGAIKLEPLVYFHDFFQGVTPGLRFTLGF